MRKDKGGLGFKDLITMNWAMLRKQAWRLGQSQNSLWGKVLKGICFPSRNFWHARRGSCPSWEYQSILMGWNSISISIMWAIGLRKNINIREDRWLKRRIIGGLVNYQEPTKVADLIIQEENRWDEMKVRTLFDEQLTSEVLAIPLPDDNKLDNLI